MSDEDYEWERYADEEIESARPRDSKVDEVKEVLLKEFLGKDAGEVVYYGRQLEVALEKSYFHWITKRGLNELKAEGAIAFTQKKLGDVTAHFLSSAATSLSKPPNEREHGSNKGIQRS